MGGLDKTKWGLLVSTSALAALIAIPAAAQTTAPSGTAAAQRDPASQAEKPASQTATPTPDAPADAATESGDIVVTGFRSSLDRALNLKRNETASVDSILAEDVGKFPDSNLAESMQRIPGVALARGDGGEGRQISVRGLGAQFTRVRIDGMEGISQVSSTDIRGSASSSRSFDFVTFPTEIFSALSVRKTPSADVEEGSLGATVDLMAPKPFDQEKHFVVSATARGIYTDFAKKADPRLSALVSKKFGTFGVLGTIAYSTRHINEFAYSASNILPAYVNGLAQPAGTPNAGVVFPYCTPVGYIYKGSPTNSPVPGYANNGNSVGADALNCSTGNPRTSTAAAFDYVMNHTGPSGRPGGGIFVPRLPRPARIQQDQERLAGSLSLQWKPDENTDVSLDGLYSRFKVDRLDTYLDGRSFGRNASNNGQPMSSIREIQVDNNGSLIYGVWDGVDIRSEMQNEQFTSTFKQLNLKVDHRFSDSFRLFGLAGVNESVLNAARIQAAMDSNNTTNFSIDFRDNPDIAKINFGRDVTNPAIFSYGPAFPNGEQRGSFGGFERRNRILSKTFELNGEWTVTPGFTFQVGGQYRTNKYDARNPQIANTTPQTGVALSDVTLLVTGVSKNLKGLLPNFLAFDPDKLKAAIGYNNLARCNLDCGRGVYGGVSEKYGSGYLMAKFNTEDILPFTLRGDAGVRYVNTNFHTYGGIARTAPAGAPYGTYYEIAKVDRSYDDWLPSLNLALDVTNDIVARFSAARVISRADYPDLIPGGSANPVNRTASTTNPFLNPIRANTFDASVEWYFAPGSLLSFAYFYKNIESFIQSDVVTVPFRDIGLPLSLLQNTGVNADELFQVSRATNSPGGPLRGYEINAQVPFRFLPGFLSNFGVLANYTRAKSKIAYNLAPGVIKVAALVGLSPETASGTLYYEDRKFSIRSTVNYRSAFLNSATSSGSVDSDSFSTAGQMFVDASASYQLTPNFKIIAEVQNITNESNRLITDSVRKDPLYSAYFGRTYALAVNMQF